MRKSIVTLFAAATAAGMIAAPAAAVEADEVSVVVSYDDLDVADPAGAAALDQRITAAVKEVCEQPDIRDLKAVVAWEKCKTSARDGAMEQLSVLAPYENLALASLF